MFHHLYSNLVLFAKSSDLNKCTFDIRKHYLEVQLFLEEVEHNPQTALNFKFSHQECASMVTRNLIRGT